MTIDDKRQVICDMLTDLSDAQIRAMFKAMEDLAPKEDKKRRSK